MFVNGLLHSTKYRAENMLDMVKNKVESITEVVVDSVHGLDRKLSNSSQTYDILLSSGNGIDRFNKQRTVADSALLEVRCVWWL